MTCLLLNSEILMKYWARHLNVGSLIGFLIELFCGVKVLLVVFTQKRHRQDDAVNNRTVDVYRENRFMSVTWTQVR